MTEEDICNTVIKVAEEYGFTVYPETSKYDFILQRGKIIIGCQAKLTINLKSLVQCVQNGVDTHFRFLVYNQEPDGDLREQLKILMRELKIVPVLADDEGTNFEAVINSKAILMYRLRPKKTVFLPDKPIVTRAGVRSPRQISEYNVNLVKLQIKCERRGYVNIQHAYELGMTRIPTKYFQYDKVKGGWVLKPNVKKPGQIYPHIYEILNAK